MTHPITLPVLAAALLTMAAGAFCETAEDYYNRGVAEHARRDFESAIADFTKAIELDPGLAPAYVERGRARYMKYDLSGALADYSKAIEVKPDFAEAYQMRGDAKVAKNDMDGAIVDFTKAIDLVPRYAQAYEMRGYAKGEKGDVDGGVADYTRAIELDPGFTIAYDHRARLRDKKGDLEGEIADYTKVIGLTPKEMFPYLNRSQARKAKGDLAGAVADCNKAIALNPRNDGMGYSLLGYLHYDLRDFTNSLADFRRTLQTLPTFDDAHFRVWLIRARMGDADAGTAELKAYLVARAAKKPEDWSAKIGRFLDGQLTEPEFLDDAKSAQPGTESRQLCDAYFYAGSKHLLAGEKAAAADCFQKSIATNVKNSSQYASAAVELKALTAGNN
jgi:tetratricopeptide (TPR) repeat protein